MRPPSAVRAAGVSQGQAGAGRALGPPEAPGDLDAGTTEPSVPTGVGPCRATVPEGPLGAGSTHEADVAPRAAVTGVVPSPVGA